MIFEYKYTYDKGTLEIFVTETESQKQGSSSVTFEEIQIKEILADSEKLKEHIIFALATVQAQITQELTPTDTQKFDEKSAPFEITVDEVQLKVDEILDDK